MKLNHLLGQLVIKQIEGDDTVEITNIEIDSRKVRKGDLFICLSGRSNEGHMFINEAVNNGAAAILVEKDVDHPANNNHPGSGYPKSDGCSFGFFLWPTDPLTPIDRCNRDKRQNDNHALN